MPDAGNDHARLFVVIQPLRILLSGDIEQVLSKPNGSGSFSRTFAKLSLKHSGCILKTVVAFTASWTVNKNIYAWESTGVIVIVQRKYYLLGTANAECGNDKFTSFIYDMYRLQP